MTLEIGIFLALLCAFVANLGFFFKQRGACSVAKVDMRHPIRSACALYSSRWFAAGMLLALISWALHVAALSIAPISVVQVTLAAGAVFIAVIADRWFGFEVGQRQRLGLILTAAGLALLALTLPASQSQGAHSQFSAATMVSFEAGLFAVGGLLIVGRHMGGPQQRHGIMLALAAGLLFGVSDVAIKALSGIAAAHGLASMLSSAWLLVALFASVVAFYASARGLQDGEPVAVIALTGTAANIAGIGGGIVVFGDALPGSPVGIAIQGLAFVLVIFAAALMPMSRRAFGAVAEQ
jgi:drug/metabolite transporter (DMT)-like permease